VISWSWSPTRLLGRDAELQTLTACLDRARAGSVAVAVLEGPAGIGKTRLVNELIARAERDGFRCLRAACEETLGRPFGPLLDALAAAGQLVSPGSGAAAVGASRPSEYRLVEELSDRLERLSATGPLLLSVDDLQWADPSTLTAIRRAARRLALGPATILVVVRSEHPPRVAGAVDDLLRVGPPTSGSAVSPRTPRCGWSVNWLVCNPATGCWSSCGARPATPCTWWS
jgi:predicted ATPase